MLSFPRIVLGDISFVFRYHKPTICRCFLGYRDCNYRDVALFLFHEEGISLAYDDWVAVGAEKVQDWMRMLGSHAGQNRTQSKESDYGRNPNIGSGTYGERSFSFLGLSNKLVENDGGRTLRS